MGTDVGYKSWRIYALALSLISVWAQWSALWGKIGEMMSKGMTPEQALEILNQAGPMLQAADQIIGLLASYGAAIFIIVSKVRSWNRARKAKAACAERIEQ
jgi:hypothetical protein